MYRLPLCIALKNYHYLPALCASDEVSETVTLTLFRMQDLSEVPSTAQVAEISLARYIRGLSMGDTSWVAVPHFPRRAFAHRAWYVRADSDIERFSDLTGLSVGTNQWLATGNVWARGAAREAGLDLDTVNWQIAPIRGSSFQTHDLQPGSAALRAGAGVDLVRDLLSGRLDALVSPRRPVDSSGNRAPIRRLVVDYPGAEKAYFERTGVYPTHHVVAVRRETFEREPLVLKWVFDALERDRVDFQNSLIVRGGSFLTPWALADLEDAQHTFGDDWQPGGAQENLAETAALCAELNAQRCLEREVAPSEVYSQFEEVYG